MRAWSLMARGILISDSIPNNTRFSTSFLEPPAYEDSGLTDGYRASTGMELGTRKSMTARARHPSNGYGAVRPFQPRSTAPGAHRTNGCVGGAGLRSTHCRPKSNVLMRKPRATEYHPSYDNEFLPS